MGLRKRIKEALDAGRRAAQIAGTDLPEGMRSQSLGALALDLTFADLVGVATAVRAAARSTDTGLILVTDSDEAVLGGFEGFVIEYLPPVADLTLTVPDGDAILYVRRRLAIVAYKWHLRQILVFGEAAADLVQKMGPRMEGLSPDLFVSGRLDDSFSRP